MGNQKNKARYQKTKTDISAIFISSSFTIKYKLTLVYINTTLLQYLQSLKLRPYLTSIGFENSDKK